MTQFQSITKLSYDVLKAFRNVDTHCCEKSVHNWAFYHCNLGTAVAQWLRCCATNRKITDSIPASVSGFFIDIKYFRSHYGPGVESVSNTNEYQEYFLGLKAAGT